MALSDGSSLVGHVHTTAVSAVVAFLLVLPLLVLLGWISLMYADTNFGRAMKSVGM